SRERLAETNDEERALRVGAGYAPPARRDRQHALPPPDELPAAERVLAEDLLLLPVGGDEADLVAEGQGRRRQEPVGELRLESTAVEPHRKVGRRNPPGAGKHLGQLGLSQVMHWNHDSRMSSPRCYA